ncbi:hypothetical protein TGMAS_234230 [Toxoplasma gondii MAS]|uniref:Uncharacterized protein n=1 Tax=Toxoplasma gondii MAS TaxID=943118 RepID=A0A086Q5T6_TOXGO|nr:hypothetical protein TGMAS_234230 [Toxoplasma gondii MAS]
MPEPTQCTSSSLPHSASSDVSDLSASSPSPPSRVCSIVSDAWPRETFVSSSAPTATDTPSEASSSTLPSSLVSSFSSSIDFQSPSPRWGPSVPRMLTRRSGKTCTVSSASDPPSCCPPSVPMCLDEIRAPLPKVWRGRGKKSRARSRFSPDSLQEYPESWEGVDEGEETESEKEARASGREDAKNVGRSEGVPEGARCVDWEGGSREDGHNSQREGCGVEVEKKEDEEDVSLSSRCRQPLRDYPCESEHRSGSGQRRNHLERGDCAEVSEDIGRDAYQGEPSRTEGEERETSYEGRTCCPHQDGETGHPSSDTPLSSSLSSPPSSFQAPRAVHELSMLEASSLLLSETPTLRTPHTSSSSSHLSRASSSGGSSASLSERREEGGSLHTAIAGSPTSSTCMRSSGSCSALFPSIPLGSAADSHEAEAGGRQDGPFAFSSCFPSSSSLSWSPVGAEDTQGREGDMQEETRESLFAFSASPGQLRHPRGSTLSVATFSSDQAETSPFFSFSSSPRLPSSLSSAASASQSPSFVSTTVESQRDGGAVEGLDRDVARKLATETFLTFAQPVRTFAEAPKDAVSPQKPFSPLRSRGNGLDSPARHTPRHEVKGSRGGAEAAGSPSSSSLTSSTSPLYTSPALSLCASELRRKAESALEAKEEARQIREEDGPRGTTAMPTCSRFSASPAFLFSPSSAGQEKPEEAARLDGRCSKAEATREFGSQDGTPVGTARLKGEGRSATEQIEASQCLSGSKDASNDSRGPKHGGTAHLPCASPVSSPSASPPSGAFPSASPPSASFPSASFPSGSFPSVSLPSSSASGFSPSAPFSSSSSSCSLSSSSSASLSFPSCSSLSLSPARIFEDSSGVVAAEGKLNFSGEASVLGAGPPFASSPSPASEPSASVALKGRDASAGRLSGENNFFSFALEAHAPRPAEALASSLGASTSALKGALAGSLAVDAQGAEGESVNWDEALGVAKSDLKDPPIPRTEDEWEALIGTSKTASFSVYLGRELLDVSGVHSIQGDARTQLEGEKREGGGAAPAPPRMKPWESVLLVLDPTTATVASPYLPDSVNETEAQRDLPIVLLGGAGDPGAAPFVVIEETFTSDEGGGVLGFQGLPNAELSHEARKDRVGNPRLIDGDCRGLSLGGEKRERHTQAAGRVEGKEGEKRLDRNADRTTRRQLGRLVLEAPGSGIGQRALKEKEEAERRLANSRSTHTREQEETCRKVTGGELNCDEWVSGELKAKIDKEGTEETAATGLCQMKKPLGSNKDQAATSSQASPSSSPGLSLQFASSPCSASSASSVPCFSALPSCTASSSPPCSAPLASSSACSSSVPSTPDGSGGSGQTPSFASFRESLQRAVSSASPAEVDPRLLRLLRLADAMEAANGGKCQEERRQASGDIRAQPPGGSTLPPLRDSTPSDEPVETVAVVSSLQQSQEKPSECPASDSFSSESSLVLSPLYRHEAPALSPAAAASPAASFSTFLFAGAPPSPSYLAVVEAQRVQMEEKQREKKGRRLLQELLRGFGGKTSDLHVPIPLCLFPPPARRLSHLSAIQMWTELRQSHCPTFASPSASSTREGTRSSRNGERRGFSLVSPGDSRLGFEASRDVPNFPVSPLVPVPEATAGSQSRVRGGAQSGGVPGGDGGFLSRGEMNFSPSSSAPSSSPISASSDRKKACLSGVSLASSPFLQPAPKAPDMEAQGAASPRGQVGSNEAGASGSASLTAEEQREVAELSLGLIRRSPDILLLPIQQQELALQQQLHQIMLCRHWWAEKMDRSLYEAPVFSEEDKNAKIIDAPPMSACMQDETSKSLGAASPTSREKDAREREKAEDGALCSGEERGRNERPPKRGVVVSAKKPVTGGEEKKKAKGARAREEKKSEEDIHAFPSILEPSNLMKEIFGLQKLPGSKAYRKLKDPRSGPPSWGTQVWFSLGRRAELEFLLRRHFYPDACKGAVSAAAESPAAATVGKKRGKETTGGAGAWKRSASSPSEGKPCSVSAGAAREKVLRDKKARKGRAAGRGRDDEKEEDLEEEEDEDEPALDGLESSASVEVLCEEGDKGSSSSTEKAEGEEDCLLHPLLLLRIANCEWRILRDFVPDVVKVFKQHVRCFKLKRNPYVTTLQQQVDYKLAVMSSLRSPFYRVASPFVDHAIRLILRHRFGVLSLSLVSPSACEQEETGAERGPGSAPGARPDEETGDAFASRSSSSRILDEPEKREGVEDEEEFRRKGRSSSYALPLFGRESLAKLPPSSTLFASTAATAASSAAHAPLPAVARSGEEERGDEQLGKGCRKKVKRRLLEDDASPVASASPSPEPQEKRDSLVGAFPFASLAEDDGQAAGVLEQSGGRNLPPDCARFLRVIQHSEGEGAAEFVETQEDEELQSLLSLFPSPWHAVRLFVRLFAARMQRGLDDGADRRADKTVGEALIDEHLLKAVLAHPWTLWLSFFFSRTKHPETACLSYSLAASLDRLSPLLPPVASVPSMSVPSASPSSPRLPYATCSLSLAKREQPADPLILPRRAFAHYGRFQEFPRFVCGGVDREKCIRRRRFRVEVRKGTGCLANSFSFSFSFSPSSASRDLTRHTNEEAEVRQESQSRLRKPASSQSVVAENSRGDDQEESPELPAPATTAASQASKKKKSRKGGKKGEGKKEERRDEETPGGDSGTSSQEKEAALEEEWSSWSLERVGVGGKYYRMIEVEEIPDDELTTAVLPPFQSSFREELRSVENEDAGLQDEPQAELAPSDKAALKVKREPGGAGPVSVSPAASGVDVDVTNALERKNTTKTDEKSTREGEKSEVEEEPPKDLDEKESLALQRHLLRTEALLRLFEYRQSVPEKLEPGLAVQFASSLIPGSHVAWWEGVILSVKEDDGSGTSPVAPQLPSTPFPSLPLKPSAFPPGLTDKKKKRSRTSAPFPSASGGNQEATPASREAGEREQEGDKGRRGKDKREKTVDARNHEAGDAADEGEEEEQGAWVEIAYQVGPRTVKRAFTTFRLFIPQNVPLAEPAEGCWRLRPRSPLCSSPPPSLARFLRLLDAQEKAEEAADSRRASSSPSHTSSSSPPPASSSPLASVDPWERALVEEGEGEEGAVRHRYKVGLLAQDVWPGAVVCVRMEENPHELHDALVLNVQTSPCCCLARHRQRSSSFSDDEDFSVEGEGEEREPEGDAQAGRERATCAEGETHLQRLSGEETPAAGQGEAREQTGRAAEAGQTRAPEKKEKTSKPATEVSAATGEKRAEGQEERTTTKSVDDTGASPADERDANLQGIPKSGVRAEKRVPGRCTCSWKLQVVDAADEANAFTVCASSHTPPSYFSSLLPTSSSRGEAAAAAPAAPPLRCALEGRRQFLPSSSSRSPVRVVAVKLLYFADAAVEWISVDVLRYRLCYDVHPQDPSVPLAQLRPRWVWVIPRFVSPLPRKLYHLQELLAALANPASASGVGPPASACGETLGGKALGDRDDGFSPASASVHTVFSRYLRVAPGTAACAKASLWYIPVDLQLHPACMPPFVHVPAVCLPSNTKKREKLEEQKRGNEKRVESEKNSETGKGEGEGAAERGGEAGNVGDCAEDLDKEKKVREKRKTGDAEDTEPADEKGRLQGEGAKKKRKTAEEDCEARATDEKDSEKSAKQDSRRVCEAKVAGAGTPTDALCASALAPPQPVAAASLAVGNSRGSSAAASSNRDSPAPQTDEKEATPILFAPTICKFLQPDLDPRALLLQNLWIYRYPSMPYFPPHTAPAIGAMLASAQGSAVSNRHAFVRREPLFAARLDEEGGDERETVSAQAQAQAGDGVAGGEEEPGRTLQKTARRGASVERRATRSESEQGRDSTGLPDAGDTDGTAPVSSTTEVARGSLETDEGRQAPPGERTFIPEGLRQDLGSAQGDAPCEKATVHAGEKQDETGVEGEHGRGRTGAEDGPGLDSPPSPPVPMAPGEAAASQGGGLQTNTKETKEEMALGTVAHDAKERRDEKLDCVSLIGRESEASLTPAAGGLNSASMESPDDRRRGENKASLDAARDSEKSVENRDETPEEKRGREKRERDGESLHASGNPSYRLGSRKKASTGRASAAPEPDEGNTVEEGQDFEEERSLGEEAGSKGVKGELEEPAGGALDEDEKAPDSEKKGDECRRNAKRKLLSVAPAATVSACSSPASCLGEDLREEKSGDIAEREEDATASSACSSATLKNKRGGRRTRRAYEGERELRDGETKEMSGGERERKKGKKLSPVTVHISKGQKDGPDREFPLSSSLSLPAALLSTNEGASSPSSSSSSSSFIEIVEVESVSTPGSVPRVVLDEDEDAARSLLKDRRGRGTPGVSSLAVAPAYGEVDLPRGSSQSSQSEALAPSSSSLSSPVSLSASPAPSPSSLASPSSPASSSPSSLPSSCSSSPSASSILQGGVRPIRSNGPRQGDSATFALRGSPAVSASASSLASASAFLVSDGERGARRAEGDWERTRRHPLDAEKEESTGGALHTREDDSGRGIGTSFSAGSWGLEAPSLGLGRGRRGDKERGVERRDEELDEGSEAHRTGRTQPVLEWHQLTWITEDEVEDERKRDHRRDSKGAKKKVKVTGMKTGAGPSRALPVAAREAHQAALAPGGSAPRDGLKRGKGIDKPPEQPGVAHDAPSPL